MGFGPAEGRVPEEVVNEMKVSLDIASDKEKNQV